jgi:hypothetical protein
MKGQAMWIRKGVRLLEDIAGTGVAVERRKYYLLAIRMTLSGGDVVRGPESCLSHQIDKHMKTEDDGYFYHIVRIDRENLVGGLFYAMEGLRVGGYRKVTISPHLAYGEKGIPGIIPPKAKLTAEIKVLEECSK